MGRMKKKHKIITDWSVSLIYTCPVTGEKVELDHLEIIPAISATEQECGMCCSGHGRVFISLFEKCKSCGKYHDSITIDKW